MTMQLCVKCGKILPIEAFHLEPRVKTGRTIVCRLCRKADRHGRHSRSKPYAALPHKRSARSALHNAIKAGKIIKPGSCEKCGQFVPSNRLDGHHHDYTQKLEVTWLCRQCHGYEHLAWVPQNEVRQKEAKG